MVRGAALWAKRNRGAVYGQGVGLQGQSYAIPTKDCDLRTLSLSDIEEYVSEFLDFARQRKRLVFQLTPIGCGLAGYNRADIEPMFSGAPPNVLWPPEWLDPPASGSSKVTT